MRPGQMRRSEAGWAKEKASNELETSLKPWRDYGGNTVTTACFCGGCKSNQRHGKQDARNWRRKNFLTLPPPLVCGT